MLTAVREPDSPALVVKGGAPDSMAPPSTLLSPAMPTSVYTGMFSANTLTLSEPAMSGREPHSL